MLIMAKKYATRYVKETSSSEGSSQGRYFCSRSAHHVKHCLGTFARKNKKKSASAAPRSSHIRQNHVEASTKMSKYNYRKQLLNQLEAERCLTKFTSAPPGVFLDLVLAREETRTALKTGLRGWKREWYNKVLILRSRNDRGRGRPHPCPATLWIY